METVNKKTVNNDEKISRRKAIVSSAAVGISVLLGTNTLLNASINDVEKNNSEMENKEEIKNRKCKITVLKRELYPDLQEKYLADPKSGKCPYFHEGQEFIVENDDFFRMLNGKFCSEAWDCISRYIYAALQGGSIMRGWTNDDKVMITCCNDGTRPVIFKLERIDI
jgi:uncharacterized repeat protein (TIGR04076 family)